MLTAPAGPAKPAAAHRAAGRRPAAGAAPSRADPHPAPSPERAAPERDRPTALTGRGGAPDNPAMPSAPAPVPAPARWAALLVALLGLGLWLVHAEARSLGRGAPVLGFDAAQYAVAARVLAREGRLATTFALPVELAAATGPPWPLAAVQPGMVVAGAAIERLAPDRLTLGGRTVRFDEPWRRERLALILPLACFLALAAAIPLTVARVLALHAPATTPAARAAAGALAGIAFVLDPEARHYATGGFTELPFTLGLVAACAMLALGDAPRRPLAFGLLLGVTGAFRGAMLWLAPPLLLALAALAPPGARRRPATLAALGFVAVLAPWWIYKWRAFGHPGFDLSALALWDGVGGATWFSLTHRAEWPAAGAAWPALAGKLARNAPRLLESLAGGAGGVLPAALLGWIAAARRAPLRPVATAVAAVAGLSLVAAALGAGWIRYLFPARVVLEAAGLLAALALLHRLPAPSLRRLAVPALAVALLAAGVAGAVRGQAEARAAARDRGLPSVATLRAIAAEVGARVPPAAPVMSNLGATLAFYADRPVVHLALAPADLAACRERVEFAHVVLAFRDADRAWPAWRAVVAEPGRALRAAEWNVRAVRAGVAPEGHRVVWLELGPRAPLAGAAR